MSGYALRHVRDAFDRAKVAAKTAGLPYADTLRLQESNRSVNMPFKLIRSDVNESVALLGYKRAEAVIALDAWAIGVLAMHADGPRR